MAAQSKIASIQAFILPQLRKLLALTRTKKLVALVAIIGGFAGLSFLVRRLVRRRPSKRTINLKNTERGQKANASKKIQLDSNFLRRLRYLLSIVVPSFKSRESLYLILLAVIVILRTFVSDASGRFSGDVSRSLTCGDFGGFTTAIRNMLLVSVANSLLAPSLKFFIDKLALLWRMRLTKRIHADYMSEMMFYKVPYLDKRVEDPDQCISQDVQKFCEGCTGMVANLIKPIADIVVFTYKMTSLMGYGGPLFIVAYFIFSSIAIRFITPNIGKLNAEKQKLEGDFRFCHTRTIQNSEAIAFYGGDESERASIDKSFNELHKHTIKILKTQLRFGFASDFIHKNMPQVFGFLVAAAPVLFGSWATLDKAELSGIMRYMASIVGQELIAIGELVQVYKRLSDLAGYTARVSDIIEAMESLKKSSKEHEKQRDQALSKLQAAATDSATTSADASEERENAQEPKLSDTASDARIRFEKVTIRTPAPDNRVLIADLSFDVLPGKNVLIAGPNAVGKSSVFRVLSGLWPCTDGVVIKPGNPNDIYYVPQRPYNVIGTLRDQIRYPASSSQRDAERDSDDNMRALLARVNIAYLIDRHGLDNVKNWDDTLSLGEQQRLAMARLFYSKPKFAILDECTSAVSIEIEKHLYLQCRDLDITCITISQRPALIAYHDVLIQLKGEAGWTLEHIDHSRFST